ncbi:hypothetical protein V8B97DRAFT_2045209 [Scleroderma yunnanense]
MASDIFSPLTLPCGRTVANRLVKVALYEHLASFPGGPPNSYHFGLYSEWAKHGWGMIITGNVQVDKQHLTLGRDIVIPRDLNAETLAPFKKLASVIHNGAEAKKDGSEGRNFGRTSVEVRPLAIMQLSHAGRQSPVLIGGRPLSIPPLAPSSVRVGSTLRTGAVKSNCRSASSPLAQLTKERDTREERSLTRADPTLRILFQTPREMTLDDVASVQRVFTTAALTALKAGFDGVQLHCAHGYLLSQFLDLKTNLRRDDYSVTPPANALRMLREIVDAIRALMPPDFVLGIKINSADNIQAGECHSDGRFQSEMKCVLDHVCLIADWGTVDFIEISGGDYESPDFMSVETTTPRQAFFAHFSTIARERIRRQQLRHSGSMIPLILLTGGLRSPAQLQAALDNGHADLLGIGRGSILCPDLPAILQRRGKGVDAMLDAEPFSRGPEDDSKLPFWFPKVRLVGASVDVSWYNIQMRRIAESHLRRTPFDPSPMYNIGAIETMLRMWIWLDWMHYLCLSGAILAVICGIYVTGY